MKLLTLIQLLITLILTSTNCLTSSPIQPNNKWFPRDLTTDQGLHSLLVSIDDKLRGIDSVRFNVNRLEMTFARMSSKIDSIESQLTTVQTFVHIKMREIYEVLLKHDFQREQTIQKCEASQSRLMHKMNMLETRFEESLNKLQGNPEVNLVKIENKQNDIMNKAMEINSSINAITLNNVKFENEINKTQKAFINNFKNTMQELAKKEHLEEVENKIKGLHNQLNKTELIWTTQNDSPKSSYLEQRQVVNDIQIELRSEAQKVGNKVNNMYNDVWKKITQLESAIKESMVLTNTTQKDLQEDLRQIFMDQRDNEGFLDIVIDRILAVIQSKFNDLHRRVENNFQTLSSAQNVITGTCQRIHDDESEYWERVGIILEKILDTFLNKTDGLSRQNTDLLEALKGHNSQMIRTVLDAKNMVVTLAEENSHDHKALDSSIHEVVKRADIITATVDELQDQLDEINGTNFMPGYYATNVSQISSNKPENPKLPIKNSNDSSTNKTIKAVEANFGNGIIKIITEDIILEMDKKELEKDLKENITIIDIKKNATNKDNEDSILYLNNAGIITWSLANGTNNEKNITNDTQKLYPIKENDNSINGKVNIDMNKENTSSIVDVDLETTFILSYINFLKGQITKEEFLQDGYPNKSFKSIQAMISYLKPLKRIRNEYLKELDKYDTEESESEIIGGRHEIFSNTNFDYEDSSDEFLTN